MPQATIVTSRLTLRPLTASASHVDLFIALDTCPLVMKYLENKTLTAEQATVDHASRLEASTTADGLGYWVGYRDEVMIGWFSLAPTLVQGVVVQARAEVGYRLLPEFWRQGYAKEGARALLQFGFEELRLEEVWGETMSVNAASRATMSACGMELARRFWVDFDDPIPGTEEGEVEYRIGREDWEKLGGEKRKF